MDSFINTGKEKLRIGLGLVLEIHTFRNLKNVNF